VQAVVEAVGLHGPGHVVVEAVERTALAVAHDLGVLDDGQRRQVLLFGRVRGLLAGGGAIGGEGVPGAADAVAVGSPGRVSSA
jgi:hypothetical protein